VSVRVSYDENSIGNIHAQESETEVRGPRFVVRDTPLADSTLLPASWPQISWQLKS